MLRITSHPLSTELATLPGISPTVQLAISHAPSRPTTNAITLLHIATCVIAKHTKKAPSTARAERKRFGVVSAARAIFTPRSAPGKPYFHNLLRFIERPNRVLRSVVYARKAGKRALCSWQAAPLACSLLGGRAWSAGLDTRGTGRDGWCSVDEKLPCAIQVMHTGGV